MKGVCTFKFMNTLTKFFQNGNAAFAKVIVHNTASLYDRKRETLPR